MEQERRLQAQAVWMQGDYRFCPKFHLHARLLPKKGMPLTLVPVWDPFTEWLAPPNCPTCGRPTCRLQLTHRGA